ncbi:hypothetical protein [Pseudoxanthomonas koreensis]|uniref:hypothetical protein n=1 Tax=Pseudoxanthomonas koreensis TaxID=266061 RepID=UPI001391CD2B|nr:hypothetical protein [Pseudoxanthomonas koreensis]KAF1697817.1 hypothetical protein CSC64_00805 [Pseudoxanthomonas koreensis]
MRTLQILALAALLPLAACGRDEPPATPVTPASGDAAAQAPADTALGRKIQQAMAEASRKLATENIRVGGKRDKGYPGAADGSRLPRAEITPQGDLLIEGKAVAVDDNQRQLLLAHRSDQIAIAQAGIAIGMRGADLGVKAATGALKSVFSGTSDEFEKQMEAEGKLIEAEANKLCTLMPGLLASQQALAAALPEFRPYATMDQSDVDDCGKDGYFDSGDGDGGTTTAAAAGDASGEPASGDHTRDAAAEADAAARGSSTPQ